MGFSEWLIVFAIGFLLFRRSTMRTLGRSVGNYSGTQKSQTPQPPPAPSPFEQYYRALDLEPGASQEKIRETYKELVKIWHPDKYMHDPKLRERAEAKLKEINTAYEKLTRS